MCLCLKDGYKQLSDFHFRNLEKSSCSWFKQDEITLNRKSIFLFYILLQCCVVILAVLAK